MHCGFLEGVSRWLAERISIPAPSMSSVTWDRQIGPTIHADLAGFRETQRRVRPRSLRNVRYFHPFSPVRQRVFFVVVQAPENCLRPFALQNGKCIERFNYCTSFGLVNR